MPAPWKRRGVECSLRTKMFDVNAHTLVSPDGKTHEFHLLDTLDWCNVVALTPDKQVVMVKQYRYGTDEETLELPGGVVEKGESPSGAVERELLEETGYATVELVATGIVAANPALQNNRLHAFIAKVQLVGAQRLDSDEDIEVVNVPLAKIPAMVARGEFSHALTVVVLAFALGIHTPV